MKNVFEAMDSEECARGVRIVPYPLPFSGVFMKNLKQYLSILFSMRFAMVILCLFVIVCVIGSVIPQGEIPAVYESAYPGWSGLILSAGFDDTFHSPWFAALTVILCINLLGCNLVHFPGILRGLRSAENRLPKGEDYPLLKAEPAALLREMGFRKTRTVAVGGVDYTYAVRNRVGQWGAWLTHLGILIIIVGFALGQMYTVKYTVYGVPGEQSMIGDTPYLLQIDDFQILLRPDDTVEQYLAKLTVTDTRTGESQSGEASVNHPWDVNGLRLYQNSTGWAADIVVYKGEELLQAETVCAGEYLTVKDREDLLVMFRAFYPDYVTAADGMPATASDRMDNPGYLYVLYYKGDVLGMNVLLANEKITVSDYTILFDNPRSYTLIQIKHDPFTWLAGLGGGVLLAALFIAFYLRTEEIWLAPEGACWRVMGRSRKGSLLYREKLTEKIQKCNEVFK